MKLKITGNYCVVTNGDGDVVFRKLAIDTRGEIIGKFLVLTTPQKLHKTTKVPVSQIIDVDDVAMSEADVETFIDTNTGESTGAEATPATSSLLKATVTFTASELGNSGTTRKTAIPAVAGKINIPTRMKVAYTHVTTGYGGFESFCLFSGAEFIMRDEGNLANLSADKIQWYLSYGRGYGVAENVDYELGLTADDLTGDGTLVAEIWYEQVDA